MNVLMWWIVTAAVVTVMACARDDAGPLVAMFVISLVLPEDIFVEGG